MSCPEVLNSQRGKKPIRDRKTFSFSACVGGEFFPVHCFLDSSRLVSLCGSFPSTSLSLWGAKVVSPFSLELSVWVHTVLTLVLVSFLAFREFLSFFFFFFFKNPARHLKGISWFMQYLKLYYSGNCCKWKFSIY